MINYQRSLSNAEDQYHFKAPTDVNTRGMPTRERLPNNCRQGEGNQKPKLNRVHATVLLLWDGVPLNCFLKRKTATSNTRIAKHSFGITETRAANMTASPSIGEPNRTQQATRTSYPAGSLGCSGWHAPNQLAFGSRPSQPQELECKKQYRTRRQDTHGWAPV